MSRLLVLTGTTLFPVEHIPRRDTVLLVEDPGFCARKRFHQQKLAYVLGCMRDARDELRAAGREVVYYEIDDGVTLAEGVRRTVRHHHTALAHFQTEDQTPATQLRDVARGIGINYTTIASPMFLTDPGVLDEWFSTNRPAMSAFYKMQRRRLGILVEGQDPVGGQWSFDAENRSRVRRETVLPSEPRSLQWSDSASRAVQDVARLFPDHPGDAAGLWLPTSRNGAEHWLEHFLSQRFMGFGTFEDAMTVRSRVVHHSVLAPILNVGLLTPSFVIDRALAFARDHNVALNDLEGFIRQIVGWREFIRGMARTSGREMRTANAWDADRSPDHSWFTADTGIVPLDHALRGATNLAWNHHIERLMVIANLMNLCGIHPSCVYDYFLRYYIDAYDWVMVPNVFGMGLTSDGGLFTTKPYICGSNYMRKMSDHGSGQWCETVDGLFWRFVDKHADRLRKNPRLALMVAQSDRIEAKRRKRLFDAADTFIGTHTQ